jgi:hypothetical protein
MNEVEQKLWCDVFVALISIPLPEASVDLAEVCANKAVLYFRKSSKTLGEGL